MISLCMALQISCQFLDYDSAEDVGLAESFQPSVKVSCVGGTMKIRVDTKKPFQGVIHGPNRTEPGCSTLGKSGLKTYLNIDLTRPSGSEVSIYLLGNYLLNGINIMHTASIFKTSKYSNRYIY